MTSPPQAGPEGTHARAGVTSYRDPSPVKARSFGAPAWSSSANNSTAFSRQMRQTKAPSTSSERLVLTL